MFVGILIAGKVDFKTSFPRDKKRQIILMKTTIYQED